MVMKRVYLWIMIGCMAVLTACGEQKESSSEPGLSASPSPVETEAVQLSDVKEEPPLVLKDFPSKEDIVFTEGRHNRNDALVRTFKTYEYRLGETVFQVENTYSEDEATEMIWQIIQMVKDTEQWMDVKVQPIGRIVVIQPDVGIKNSLYSADAATVYIHPESLQSGSYVGALYEAAYPQITEVWMRQGLGFLVQQYADKGINTDTFRETIADFNEPDMLSLFGVYYYDFVNDREAIQKAQQAAASVLLHAEEKYGREGMLSWLCGNSEHTNLATYNEWIAQDWLSSVASDTNLPLWEGIGYGFSDYYDIILYMGEYDYQVVWTPEEAIELNSVSGLEHFVVETDLLIEELGDLLEKVVTETGNTVDRSYFHIIVDETVVSRGGRGGVTHQGKRTIELYHRPSLVVAHELVHLFTACVGDQWIREGVAEYISNIYLDTYSDDTLYDIRYAAMNEVMLSPKSKSELQKYAVEYFTKKSFVANDVSTFTPMLYHEGIAYALLMMENGNPSRLIDETKYLWYEGGSNYDVFLTFINRLVEKTSLTDVISVLYDGSLFEEKFGGTFETICNEWIEELMAQ